MTRVKLDQSSVARLLEKGGWSCERVADGMWRSLFQGRVASFPFFVRVDPAGWVNFAIVPFLKTPPEEPRAKKLYARILQLNHTLLMAKFSIDDDLDIVLSVEYPTAELDESEFVDALDVLSYYAERHYDELRSLAAGSPASG